MRSCLVTEAQTLLRLSGVHRWVHRWVQWWVPGARGRTWREWIGQVLQAGIAEGSPSSHPLHLLCPGWSLCSSAGALPVWPVPILWLRS